MAELTTAVCSITSTQRRRFFGAAWWTGAPARAPFRKPDAADGGAKSRAEALAAAERAAGRHLSPIDDYWARAWKCVLRGEPVPPLPRARAARQAATEAPTSAWSVLGLAPGASAAEVRAAFHKRALATHPDHGGDAAEFRAVLRAFQRLTKHRTHARRPRRRARAG
jgi:hypothetical protein